MDFVKQHIALVVSVFVVWFTYGRLSEEDASAAAAFFSGLKNEFYRSINLIFIFC